MTFCASAVVVREIGVAPRLEPIEVDGPAADEVVVAIVAAGICHTDLSCWSGRLEVPTPIVLGHEGAGVVVEVGSHVDRFEPGDRVVISVAHHCGRCRWCEAGRPPLCEQRAQQRQRLSVDGGVVHQGFGTGTFATHVVVRERSLVAVPDGISFAVAAITGCAAVTGLGAAIEVARVSAGDRVAVLGGGGVGACAAMGAALAGAEVVVVSDPSPLRRADALGVGATHAVAAGVDALLDVCADGFDHVMETAGVAAAVDVALSVVATGGSVTLLGLPGAELRLALPVQEVVTREIRVQGCNMGRFRPNLDIPRWLRLQLAGKLSLDRLVGAEFPMAQAAAAFDAASQSGAGRTLLGHPEP